jgi:hypothetical protein
MNRTTWLQDRRMDKFCARAGHSALYGHMIGSRAERVVHLAPCLVLVKGKRRDDPSLALGSQAPNGWKGATLSKRGTNQIHFASCAMTQEHESEG